MSRSVPAQDERSLLPPATGYLGFNRFRVQKSRGILWILVGTMRCTNVHEYLLRQQGRARDVDAHGPPNMVMLLGSEKEKTSHQLL